MNYVMVMLKVCLSCQNVIIENKKFILATSNIIASNKKLTCVHVHTSACICI
jgi:dihydroxyacetone kinase-like predicted kinase